MIMKPVKVVVAGGGEAVWLLFGIDWLETSLTMERVTPWARSPDKEGEITICRMTFESSVSSEERYAVLIRRGRHYAQVLAIFPGLDEARDWVGWQKRMIWVG